MNLQEIKQACADKIENAFVIAEKRYEQHGLIPRPRIIWNDALTSTAGRARTKHDPTCPNGMRPVHIELSTPIARLNPEIFVDDTPAHEAAHNIAYFVFGRNIKAHGAEWKGVMRAIGEQPTRTHNMVTPQNGRTPYHCNCQVHMVSKIRVNRMRTMTYRCKVCKSDILPGVGPHTTVTRTMIRKDPAIATIHNNEVTGIVEEDVVREWIRKFQRQSIFDMNVVLASDKIMERVCKEARVDRQRGRQLLISNWKKV